MSPNCANFCYGIGARPNFEISAIIVGKSRAVVLNPILLIHNQVTETRRMTIFYTPFSGQCKLTEGIASFRIFRKILSGKFLLRVVIWKIMFLHF